MLYKNYRNKYNRRRQIYSYEDIMKKSLNDIFENENDYLAQYNTIGIPRNSELEASVNTQWVKPFINEAGESDGGFWESIATPTKQYTNSDFSLKSNNDKIVFSERENSQGALQKVVNPIKDKIETVFHKDKDNISDDGLTGMASDLNKYVNDKFFQNDTIIQKMKNDGMNISDAIQCNLYENTLSNIYPISSEFVRNGMNNLEDARKNENAEVLDNIKGLKTNIQHEIKKLGGEENSSVVIYNVDSEISKSFSESPEVKNLVNREDIIKSIKNGTYDSEIGIHFASENIIDTKNFDRHSSIQHAKLLNPVIKDGYLEGTIVDYYDFKKRDKTLKNIPNNWGYNMQESGLLTPYGICIKIRTKL